MKRMDARVAKTQRVFSAVSAVQCLYRLRYTFIWLLSKWRRGEHIARCQPLRQHWAEGEL